MPSYQWPEAPAASPYAALDNDSLVMNWTSGLNAEEEMSKWPWPNPQSKTFGSVADAERYHGLMARSLQGRASGDEMVKRNASGKLLYGSSQLAGIGVDQRGGRYPVYSWRGDNPNFYQAKAQDIAEFLKAEEYVSRNKAIADGQLVPASDADQRVLGDIDRKMSEISGSNTLSQGQKNDAIRQLQVQREAAIDRFRQPHSWEIANSPETKKAKFISTLPAGLRDTVGQWMQQDPQTGMWQLPRGLSEYTIMSPAQMDKMNQMVEGEGDQAAQLVALGRGTDVIDASGGNVTRWQQGGAAPAQGQPGKGIEMIVGSGGQFSRWTEQPGSGLPSARPSRYQARFDRDVVRTKINGQEVLFLPELSSTGLGWKEVTGPKAPAEAKAPTFEQSATYGGQILEAQRGHARIPHLGKTTPGDDGKTRPMTDEEIDATPEMIAGEAERQSVAEEYADAHARGLVEPKQMTEVRDVLQKIKEGKVDATQEYMNQLAKVMQKYAVRHSDRTLGEWAKSEAGNKRKAFKSAAPGPAAKPAAAGAPKPRTRATTMIGAGPSSLGRTTSPVVAPANQEPTPPRGISQELLNATIAAALQGNEKAIALLDKEGVKWRK